MSELPYNHRPSPQEPLKTGVSYSFDSTSATPASYVAYLKFIDSAKRAAAVGMVFCGLAFILCVNINHRESRIGVWAGSVFGFGVLACLLSTFVLVVEHLVRPAPTRFTLRSAFLRLLLTLVAAAAVCLGMGFGYGFFQGIGGAICMFLVLAAVHAHHLERWILAALATLITAWALLTTQSEFQYARWHADDIVAGGCELMERCPSSGFRNYKLGHEGRPLFGEVVEPSDPRVPPVLRKMGAQRIWVDEERVAVFVGVNRFDFTVSPPPKAEFQIFRIPHPTTTRTPVWGSPGKDSTKFTDRLWTNLY